MELGASFSKYNQKIKARLKRQKFFTDLLYLLNSGRRLKVAFELQRPKRLNRNSIIIDVYDDPTKPRLLVKKTWYQRFKLKLWIMEMDASYKLLLIIIFINSYM